MLFCCGTHCFVVQTIAINRSAKVENGTIEHMKTFSFEILPIWVIGKNGQEPDQTNNGEDYFLF